MKKYIQYIKTLSIIPILWIFFVLSGCWNKTYIELNFDDFYVYFYTTNTFEKKDIDTDWLSQWLLKNDILNTYIQTNNSWYTDSIIIIKKNTSKSLVDFVKADLEKTKLNWYNSDNINTTTFKCNSKKIDINIVESKLSNNLTTTFFTQAFFINTWQIYIVSFSTQQEEQNNTFASNIENIKCKK